MKTCTLTLLSPLPGLTSSFNMVTPSWPETCSMLGKRRLTSPLAPKPPRTRTLAQERHPPSLLLSQARPMSSLPVNACAASLFASKACLTTRLLQEPRQTNALLSQARPISLLLLLKACEASLLPLKPGSTRPLPLKPHAISPLAQQPRRTAHKARPTPLLARNVTSTFLPPPPPCAPSTTAKTVYRPFENAVSVSYKLTAKTLSTASEAGT